MVNKRAMRIARKSTRRQWIVDEILKTISAERIYRTLDYRHKSEAHIKQYLHQPLKSRVNSICKKLWPGASKTTLKRKAKDALLWEADVNTTMNPVRFFGVQHRSDFVVKIGGIKIAIKVKRGETGNAIREGLGQSLIYASCEDFDFVVYLFIDTSKDKKIKVSFSHMLESALIKSLWDDYNIRFKVV